MVERESQLSKCDCLTPSNGLSLTQALDMALTVPPPRLNSSDMFILARGYPVVPWIPLKPAELIWQIWLTRLKTLFDVWSATPAQAPEEAAWKTWYSQHVHMVNALTPEDGQRQFLSLVEGLPVTPDGRIHIVGHSVGALAVIRLVEYLRRHEADVSSRLASVVSLDAASSGLHWSGAAHIWAKRATPTPTLTGLGAWTAAHGVCYIELTNESDWWSVGRFADAAYVAVHCEKRIWPRDQFNGVAHDQVRRWPLLAEQLWR